MPKMPKSAVTFNYFVEIQTLQIEIEERKEFKMKDCQQFSFSAKIELILCPNCGLDYIYHGRNQQFPLYKNFLQ